MLPYLFSLFFLQAIYQGRITPMELLWRYLVDGKLRWSDLRRPIRAACESWCSFWDFTPKQIGWLKNLYLWFGSFPLLRLNSDLFSLAIFSILALVEDTIVPFGSLIPTALENVQTFICTFLSVYLSGLRKTFLYVCSLLNRKEKFRESPENKRNFLTIYYQCMYVVESPIFTSLNSQQHLSIAKFLSKILQKR